MTAFLARLLLLATLAAAASAQTATLEGTVRDLGGAPLPGVSVYLAGTTRGDATDADGRYAIEAVSPGLYRLVGSMVGYETGDAAIQVQPGQPLSTDLTLAPAVQTMGTVRVEARRDRAWVRRVAQVEQALIGTSARAESVQILNPEVLTFQASGSGFEATVRAPLVVENRALGYRLVYDLRALALSDAEVRYVGTERFEPLEPASAAEAVRWAAARVRAYRGSRRHLLRALLAETAEAEGFAFSLDQARVLRRVAFRRTTPQRRFFRIEGRGGWLGFRGRLHVRYDEPEDPAFLDSPWAGERDRPADTQQSAVEFGTGDGVWVDPQGTLADPLAVVLGGYLAFERLADALPADYVLPPRPRARD